MHIHNSIPLFYFISTISPNNSIADDFVSKLKYNKEDILFVSYDSMIDGSITPSFDIKKIIEKHFNDKSLNSHEVNPIYLKNESLKAFSVIDSYSVW